MRLLAIGDIHGYARVLDRLLEAVQPTPDDQIVTLGDYVDRGPDSRGVIERMLALHRTGQLVALRGNHDVMMLQARQGWSEERNWQLCGGNTTLASYAAPGREGHLDDVPAEHWDFLEEVCVDWYETDTHFFVHANAYPEVDLEDQPLYMLHWEPVHDPQPHCSGKIMVCGHTKQIDGRPRNWGHTICLDTWVYGDGWLTCLDVGTGKIWQANWRGELRTDWLDGAS